MTRRTLLGSLGAGLSAAPRLGAATSGRIKITGFQIHKVTVRWRDLLFLEVQTDGGITGLGEATLEGRSDAVETELRWLEDSYIGRDPSGPEEHWNRSYYLLSRWRNGPAAMSALSGIDIALWDLEGKRLGVPVSRLLGGPLKPQMRVYYTHWGAALETTGRRPEDFADWARQTRDQGWTAVKWTIAPSANENQRIAAAVRELDAVRKAVGHSMDLALEAAEMFSVRSAIQFAEAVAPYHPLWIEEPTLRESPAGLGQVAGKSAVPVATGEGLFSRFEFQQLLEKRGAAIVQPDVMHAGGITEIRKIANLAETSGAEVAPHQCSGMVGHVASLHAMSVCRNFLIQEWEAADDPLFLELTDGHYPVQKNGTVELPSAPGLGISVNFAEFEKRCPYRGVRRKSLIGQ